MPIRRKCPSCGLKKSSRDFPGGEHPSDDPFLEGACRSCRLGVKARVRRMEVLRAAGSSPDECTPEDVRKERAVKQLVTAKEKKTKKQSARLGESSIVVEFMVEEEEEEEEPEGIEEEQTSESDDEESDEVDNASRTHLSGAVEDVEGFEADPNPGAEVAQPMVERSFDMESDASGDGGEDYFEGNELSDREIGMILDELARAGAIDRSTPKGEEEEEVLLSPSHFVPVNTPKTPGRPKSSLRELVSPGNVPTRTPGRVARLVADPLVSQLEGNKLIQDLCHQRQCTLDELLRLVLTRIQFREGRRKDAEEDYRKVEQRYDPNEGVECDEKQRMLNSLHVMIQQSLSCNKFNHFRFTMHELSFRELMDGKKAFHNAFAECLPNFVTIPGVWGRMWNAVVLDFAGTVEQVCMSDMKYFAELRGPLEEFVATHDQELEWEGEVYVDMSIGSDTTSPDTGMHAVSLSVRQYEVVIREVGSEDEALHVKYFLKTTQDVCGVVPYALFHMKECQRLLIDFHRFLSVERKRAMERGIRMSFMGISFRIHVRSGSLPHALCMIGDGALVADLCLLKGKGSRYFCFMCTADRRDTTINPFSTGSQRTSENIEEMAEKIIREQPLQADQAIFHDKGVTPGFGGVACWEMRGDGAFFHTEMMHTLNHFALVIKNLWLTVLSFPVVKEKLFLKKHALLESVRKSASAEFDKQMLQWGVRTESISNMPTGGLRKAMREKDGEFELLLRTIRMHSLSTYQRHGVVGGKDIALINCLNSLRHWRALERILLWNVVQEEDVGKAWNHLHTCVQPLMDLLRGHKVNLGNSVHSLMHLVVDGMKHPGLIRWEGYIEGLAHAAYAQALERLNPLMKKLYRTTTQTGRNTLKQTLRRLFVSCLRYYRGNEVRIRREVQCSKCHGFGHYKTTCTRKEIEAEYLSLSDESPVEE